MSGVPFFPRGSGPLVSVLLPSRGRPDQLWESVKSLVVTAGDPSCIEVLLKVDDDDAHTVDSLQTLKRDFSRVTFQDVVSPRGNGYRDFHLWINNLASRSTGDWLLLWNDDVRMKTFGWDAVLRNMVVGSSFVGVHDVFFTHPPGLCAFCFVRRKVFEILGHLSLHSACDTWLVSVMNVIAANGELPIQVENLRSTVGWTQAQIEDRESTISQLPRFRRAMAADIITLCDHLEAQEGKAVWTDKPLCPGWYVWKSVSGRRETVSVDELGRVMFWGYGDIKVSPDRLLEPRSKWHLLNGSSNGKHN